MNLPSIDEQIAAKWTQLGTYRDAPFAESDIDRMTRIVLEVQELYAAKALAEMVGCAPEMIQPFTVAEAEVYRSTAL